MWAESDCPLMAESKLCELSMDFFVDIIDLVKI